MNSKCDAGAGGSGHTHTHTHTHTSITHTHTHTHPKGKFLVSRSGEPQLTADPMGDIQKLLSESQQAETSSGIEGAL